MSALIRRRSLYGGLIMSASHNPAGPGEALWGGRLGEGRRPGRAGGRADGRADGRQGTAFRGPACGVGWCTLPGGDRPPTHAPTTAHAMQRRTGASSSTTLPASPPLRRSPTRSTASPPASASSRWGWGWGVRWGGWGAWRRAAGALQLMPHGSICACPPALCRCCCCCSAAAAAHALAAGALNGMVFANLAAPCPPRCVPLRADGRHPRRGPVQGRHHQVWVL